jgi:leucyl aminopeptidase
MAKKTATPAGAAATVHAASLLAFAAPGAKDSGESIPVWLIEAAAQFDKIAEIDAAQRAWASAQGFNPSVRRAFVLPGRDGHVAGVVAGASVRDGAAADPMARTELIAGTLATQLPPGRYHFATPFADAELAAVAWGLGGYRFRRYKSGEADPAPQLVMPDGVDAKRVAAIVDGAAFGRDLINTPANDMGPAEIEAAARRLADVHGATVTSVIGDDLLAQNFPLIHAVGRASPRAPRLIDLRWQPAGVPPAVAASAPKITLVGKGIAFDTGGLDLKPSSGMLIMKKDMGGAAAVLSAAHMIMSAGLPVRLRVLIAAAENSVAGNAFRPLDVIKSRAGITVEIGNTDAEGRLVLADALALADEESPDMLMTFATLTGAARVALGPDLPPFFCDDDAVAASLSAAGLGVADPLWRLPFWSAYDAGLESQVADINNVADGPFGGAIIAALFLRRFVKKARCFAHFDIYGWRAAPKALGPKGGEVNGARAVFAMLEKMTKA